MYIAWPSTYVLVTELVNHHKCREICIIVFTLCDNESGKANIRGKWVVFTAHSYTTHGQNMTACMHKSINQAITLSTNQLMRWQNDKSQIFAYHLKYVEYEEYFSFHSQGSFECFFGLFFVLVNVTFYYDPSSFFFNKYNFFYKWFSFFLEKYLRDNIDPFRESIFDSVPGCSYTVLALLLETF